ncbi:MAG: phosphomannomutase/phosphoglucomutase [Actinomycetota bacterium]
MDLSPIFKAYDVRGVFPDQITEEACRRIGAAFGSFAAASTVIVGRDMRVSSPALSAAFMEGLTVSGVDVLNIGLVSTDALYFASGQQMLPGAMFTASHNPGNYNGIKFCLAGAAPVGEETGLTEIRRLAERGMPAHDTPGEVLAGDVVDDFAEHVLGFIDLSRLRPLKVVIDAANGMAGMMVPRIFDQLAVEVIPLYFELDGTFPNHPADPIKPENLVDLIAAVRREGADIGLAFDGDADRVFLIDENGEVVSGSLTTALVASRILASEPGAKVVHNLICSRIVSETIVAAGGEPVRTRVGHSFIKQVMAETKAVFGGEHSGHYYFRDNFRADSGVICALLVLEAISVESRTLSDLLLPLRKYFNSGEINTKVADQKSSLKALADMCHDGVQDWTDGLTVDYPSWWFNARGSNTEPLLRLNVEADSDELCKRMTEELLTKIRSQN